MKKTIEYKTQGTCSRGILIEVEDNVIVSCKFNGGCAGNTQGVSALVTGMKVDEAIKKLKGIKSRVKCPESVYLEIHLSSRRKLVVRYLSVSIRNKFF